MIKISAFKTVIFTFFGLISIGQLIFVQEIFANLGSPEFTEPIKNITTAEGSNVELSCFVKYLGSYRVIWIKKEGDNKEIFVAINSLKITKNPRITVAVMQTSDDITQSNVYIQNAGVEDTGKYECAVNTNPMISQIGDFEVTKSESNKIDSDESSIHTSSNKNQTPSKDIKILENNNFDTDNIGNNNLTLCLDMQSFWEDATDSIKEFLKNVFNSFVNFTCSFLTLNS